MVIENVINMTMMGMKMISRMILLVDCLYKSRTARLFPFVGADFF